MLGFSAFAEQAFGATVSHQGVVVIVTGSGVAVSQGTPTYTIGATVVVTGSGVTVSQNANGITFTNFGKYSSQLVSISEARVLCVYIRCLLIID